MNKLDEMIGKLKNAKPWIPGKMTNNEIDSVIEELEKMKGKPMFRKSMIFQFSMSRLRDDYPNNHPANSYYGLDYNDFKLVVKFYVEDENDDAAWVDAHKDFSEYLLTIQDEPLPLLVIPLLKHLFLLVQDYFPSLESIVLIEPFQVSTEYFGEIPNGSNKAPEIPRKLSSTGN